MQEQFEGFYKGRKVLITGHTGFKGSWLSLILHQLGAEIYGYALDPPTEPSLYRLANIDELVSSTIGDIRNYEKLLTVVQKVRPEIVIHMAAQPLVRESYKNPRETYEVNVMGTLNLFEVIRETGGVKAVLNVTTDKCYENKEWHWGYRENDPLCGYDPYSNSKSCSELVTFSFRNSFFNPADYAKHMTALASARAGNVIGGGDWAEDRLIPDIFKSILQGSVVKIRSPHAIRPWQHVLEPLSGYLLLCKKLATEGIKYAEGWNFGPKDDDVLNVESIVKYLGQIWDNGVNYEIDKNPSPHEASYLKLDCSKANSELDWHPHWNIERSLNSIADWYKAYLAGENIRNSTNKQISEYFNC
ncbi:MAG: CDP-glucose 4,6-dehydratase [Bacteroidetes bacterium]|nr:CDP-glucose 4,6-dehydratase [Bacteroidota bacterium]